jgi:hypothetical protein
LCCACEKLLYAVSCEKTVVSCKKAKNCSVEGVKSSYIYFA